MAETPTTGETHAVLEEDHASSTAGWFAGAAGQLAASRGNIGSVPELGDTLGSQQDCEGGPSMLILCHKCHTGSMLGTYLISSL